LPGNQHLRTASDGTVEKYDNRKASCRAIFGQGLRRVHPRPHGISASDALRGRGSATPDELIAATYVGSELRQYGIDPVGDDGGYIQRAQLLTRVLNGPPQLTFTTAGNGNAATRSSLEAWKRNPGIAYVAARGFGSTTEIDLAAGEQKVNPGLSSFSKRKKARTRAHQ